MSTTPAGNVDRVRLPESDFAVRLVDDGDCLRVTVPGVTVFCSCRLERRLYELVGPDIRAFLIVR